MLNIGLDLGVISSQLFTMLVIMALVTTFMAGPILRLIDPREALRARRGGASPRTPCDHGQDRGARPGQVDHGRAAGRQNVDALLELAEPLAKSAPPQEIIIAQVVIPDRFVTGVGRDLEQADNIEEELAEGQALVEGGTAARVVAFNTVLPGQDYVRLASEEEVDLIMLDGRRPLLGEGVPREPSDRCSIRPRATSQSSSSGRTGRRSTPTIR